MEPCVACNNSRMHCRGSVYSPTDARPSYALLRSWHRRLPLETGKGSEVYTTSPIKAIESLVTTDTDHRRKNVEKKFFLNTNKRKKSEKRKKIKNMTKTLNSISQ